MKNNLFVASIFFVSALSANEAKNRHSAPTEETTHESFKNFLEKNQAKFNQEIQNEKKRIEEDIKNLDDAHKVLNIMNRIVGAFNGKNAQDEEATLLAQQAYDKMQYELDHQLPLEEINNGQRDGKKTLSILLATLAQLNDYCSEQISKNPLKKTEYKAQLGAMHVLLGKYIQHIFNV